VDHPREGGANGGTALAGGFVKKASFDRCIHRREQVNFNGDHRETAAQTAAVAGC
jgi:hypothetical protein